jgi:hypothetical protein
VGGVTTTVTRSTISGNVADGVLQRDRDFNTFPARIGIGGR